MKLTVEQLRIRNDDAQAVWMPEGSVELDVPTRILVDDEVVWESQP